MVSIKFDSQKAAEFEEQCLKNRAIGTYGHFRLRGYSHCEAIQETCYNLQSFNDSPSTQISRSFYSEKMREYLAEFCKSSPEKMRIFIDCAERTTCPPLFLEDVLNMGHHIRRCVSGIKMKHYGGKGAPLFDEEIYEKIRIAASGRKKRKDKFK